MKKYLSKLTTMWIVLFVLMTCNLSSHDFTFVWDLNPNADLVDRYYVYPVVTVDSIQVPLDIVNFWQSFSHDSLKLINPTTASVIYSDVIDNNYLQFSITARNIIGESVPGYSTIIRKTPDSVPGQVLNAGVLK